MTTYGLVNWGDVEVKRGGANRVNKDLYMKLQNGDNIVRIITKPHQYESYQYKTNPDDKGFGYRILVPTDSANDPIKKLGRKDLKPKRRWWVGIIDRRTQSYKLLDLSAGAFNGIRELVNDEDWGDPSQYDINIKVDKDAPPANYYAVIPKSKKPLSAADLELRQQVDLEDLKRRCTPPTVDQVIDRMKSIDEKTAGAARAVVATETATPAEEDEENIDFPAVDGSDS